MSSAAAETNDPNTIHQGDLLAYGIDPASVTPWADDQGTAGAQLSLPAIGLTVAFWDDGVGGWHWASASRAPGPDQQINAGHCGKRDLLLVLARHNRVDQKRAARVAAAQ